MVQKISHYTFQKQETYVKKKVITLNSFLVPSAPEKQENKHLDELNAACDVEEYSII